MEPALSVPDWLNAEFLQSALQNGLGTSNGIEVTKFDVQSAAPKGDHFASSLYRVIVNYRNGSNPFDKTSHLIVKSLPTAEIMRQLLTEAKIFKRETDVYLIVLPAMYSLLEEATGPGVQYLTSKCLCCKSDILVFEDLKNLGYKMANRRSGLDLSHCKIALKGLARFHAMSVALHKKDPTCMSNFSEGLFIESRKPILDSYMEGGIKCLASVVEKWTGYERFGEKLRRVAEIGVDGIIDVVKPREDYLSVLNHGDFWVNNIMFRYSSSGDVESVSFVDFQTSRFSSPALDLQYFIYTSPSETVRFNNVDELLELYHVEFRNHLCVLGCDDVEFTFEELKEEFSNRAFYGLITVCTLLHLVLGDPDAALDIEHLTDNNTSNEVEMTPVEKSYWDPVYRDQLQKLLVHFESKGVL